MQNRLAAIKKLSERPLTDDRQTRRVEIVILKFKEEPHVIDECVSRILHHTTWPFKLNIYDNRLNSANTSKAWNKLIRESTCDYVLIIDSDAFIPKDIEPCWLTRMMESIEETGIVVPMGDNVGGTNKATAAEGYPSSKAQNGIWSGFCFLIKKSIMDSVRWFDESFNLYGQDSEFAFRTRAIYRTDVFVQHLGSYSAEKEEKETGFDREADRLYAAALYRLKTSGKL